MTLSKKQKIIIWITVLFIIILFGLEYSSGIIGSSLDWYGLELNIQTAPDFVVELAEHKYPLLVAVLIIGLTGVLTSKKKA